VTLPDRDVQDGHQSISKAHERSIDIVHPRSGNEGMVRLCGVLQVERVDEDTTRVSEHED